MLIAIDTNRTIQCPKCAKIFYRNDLLQRHLTLKHRRSPRKSIGLEEPNLSCDFPAEPSSSNGPNDHLPSSLDSEPLANTGNNLQDTHLTQGGSGISPMSTLSADSPGLLLLRSPVPVSPFPLENNGHNYEWMYQPHSEPTSNSVIHGLQTYQGDLGQNCVSLFIAL